MRSRTKRLQKALCALGLKIGGQAGADVGSELGISGSRDTILRLVRQSEPPALDEPHVIGLDDWAWKRRLRYGTLICDLEGGLPIDLLPDRTVETVSAWLKEHPSIDTISRDGSSEYASVQMERESGRFRKKCWPLFTPYCQKRDSSNHQFGRNTGRNS